MASGRPPYLAYMLRLWQEPAESGSQWRASLESPHSGERRGFASLEALFAFLRMRAEGDSPGSQPQAGIEPDRPAGLSG